MTFGNPWLLALLVVPVALGWWTWSRRGRAVAVPFDHAGRRGGAVLRALIRIGETLPAALLAVAVLLLAGPRRLDAPRVQRAMSNIEFALDVSGSMIAQFGEGTRYDAAMAAINEFLDYREGDAFGLTFFGNNVLHWVPLTTDVSAFRCAPPFMDPRNEGRPNWFGGTEIGKALLACRKVLTRRESGDRMIILVSDGMSFDLSNGADLEIARQLRDDRIVVYGVHIGGGEVPPPIVNITTFTGGMAFEPGDPVTLSAVFEQIDAMQATRMEKLAAEQVDDFAVLCWIGLSVLGLYGLVQVGLRYVPW